MLLKFKKNHDICIAIEAKDELKSKVEKKNNINEIFSRLVAEERTLF